MQETFANRLKKALQMKNIKPSELAEKSGVPKSAISQYLSGLYEAKQRNIDKLAKVLNVSEAWLMGHDVPIERDINKKLSSEYDLDLSSLNNDQLKKVAEYIEFLKSKEDKK